MTASASLVGRRAGALRRADAGVVDQHVEPAEALDRLRDGGVDRRLVAHIAGDDVLAGLEVEPHDAGAARAQLGRRRGADAARGAGEQDLSCEHRLARRRASSA